MLPSRTPRLVAAGLAAAALVAAAHSQGQADPPPRVVPTAQHEPRSEPRPGPALDDAGYRSIADRLVLRLTPLWDERLERYEPGPGATTSQINADLLLVHASAARAGHTGPSRQDARARAAARYLTSPEIWRGFWPGWRPGDARAMHPVFQAEVAEGLAAAYRARRRAGAGGVDGAQDPAPARDHGRRPALALARADAQSVQLVHDDRCRRRDGQRHRPRARRLASAPPGPLHRPAGRQPRPGSAFPLRHALSELAGELRLGRVREHRAWVSRACTGTRARQGCRGPRRSGSCANGSGARWPVTGPTRAT